MPQNGLDEYVTREDLEQIKRLQIAQVQSIDQKIETLKKMGLGDVSSAIPLGVGAKNLLEKQVQKMFKQIEFLNKKVIDLEKQINQLRSTKK